MLVKEDGTLVAGANSFADREDWDAYWTLRNRVDLVNLSDEAKDAALVFASTDLAWGYEWRGFLVDTRKQNFPWPRHAVVDDDERTYQYPNSASSEGKSIPTRLVEATIEMGGYHVNEALNIERVRGGEVKRERVGPILTDYFESAVPGNTYPFVERLISGLHDGARGNPRGQTAFALGVG